MDLQQEILAEMRRANELKEREVRALNRIADRPIHLSLWERLSRAWNEPTPKYN